MRPPAETVDATRWRRLRWTSPEPPVPGERMLLAESRELGVVVVECEVVRTQPDPEPEWVRVEVRPVADAA